MLLEGKRILVTGITNESSLAFPDSVGKTEFRVNAARA